MTNPARRAASDFPPALAPDTPHRLGNDFSIVLGGGVNARLYSDSDYNMYNAANRRNCVPSDRGFLEPGWGQ